MLASEFKSNQFQVINPNIPLREASEMMLKYGVNILLAIKQKRIVGYISARSILNLSEYDFHRFKVKDVMNRSLLFCFENQDIQAIAEKMRRQSIPYAIILDHNQELRGIFSLYDISERWSGKLARGKNE
ncbi:CBS domain-containing protein [bacterium]|nr:CBS domain-containing protein [bacterium]